MWVNITKKLFEKHTNKLGRFKNPEDEIKIILGEEEIIY